MVSLPVLNVLGGVPSDDLNAGRVAVGSDASVFASGQNVSGSGLGVSRKVVGLQEGRVGHQGQDLAEKGDGVLAHGVGVANVGLDDVIERLLDSLKTTNDKLEGQRAYESGIRVKEQMFLDVW